MQSDIFPLEQIAPMEFPFGYEACRVSKNMYLSPYLGSNPSAYSGERNYPKEESRAIIL